MRLHSLLSLVFCLSCGTGAADAPPVPELQMPVDPPAPKPPTLRPLVRLTTSPTDSQTFLNTAKGIAVTADGTIHVAWLEIIVAAPFPGHARQGQILYSRSADGGMSFSAPRM